MMLIGRLEWLALCLLSACAVSCAPAPVECQEPTTNDHEWTAELARLYAFVLFDEQVANAEAAAGSDGMALEVAEYIVHADDTRRPELDLCCRVLARDEGLTIARVADVRPTTDGLYVAAVGALFAEGDDTTPVAYGVTSFTTFEKTPGCNGPRNYDGFESVEDLFEFVNGVPAVYLAGASYEAMLNPPVEPYEGP